MKLIRHNHSLVIRTRGLRKKDPEFHGASSGFKRSFLGSLLVGLLMLWGMNLISPELSAYETVGPYRLDPRDRLIKGYPCSSCHKNYKRGFVALGPVKDHENLVFKHMPEVHQCDLCHSNQRPNDLHLLDGTIVGVNESYKVCAQCHGNRAFDWEAGMHGRITGYWNGDRSITNCASCHDPHSPKFKSFEAIPLTHIPKFLIRKDEVKEESP